MYSGNQKELTVTFMMISNLNKPFGLHDLYKNNSALYGLNDRPDRKVNTQFYLLYPRA